MRSSQEISIEKHAEKIAEQERKRLKAIEDGLNRLDSLDQDKVGQELPKSAYVAHAHEDLKRLLARTNLIVPE
jgi:hypothetical protein